MDKLKKQKRDFLRNIHTKDEYKRTKDKLMLTDRENAILDFIFINGYNYQFIADKMGYSESNIKKIVSKILEKI